MSKTAISPVAINEWITNIKYEQIMSMKTPGTSYSTVNLNSNKKFSDYDFIHIICYRAKWLLTSATISVTVFSNSSSTTGACPVGFWNGTLIEFDIKYTSDTSVDIKYICDTTQSDLTIRIYGVKLNA